MELIAEETLHDILLKLPTRDVARCRCVCKPWRRLLSAPSFCRLHARAGSVSGGAEALLVSQARRRGKTMETNVLSVSSPKAMCRVVDLAEGYRVMSVCNGFIVLASGEKEDPSKSGIWDPLFVCNPVTGEKLEVPAPPALKSAGRHLFAMGFCAMSNGNHQYKLFRLPFHEHESTTTDDNHLDVYTFGGGGGRWRRHPYPFRREGVCWAGSPPVLVDGKIYVLTKHKDYVTTPNNVVVIDVASEAHHIYYLMMNQRTTDAGMCMLDLGGQPCIAVHVPIPYHPGGHSELHLWVMPTPQLVQGARQPRLEKKLLGHWTRRYSFSCDRGPIAYTRGYEVAPMGIWVEGGGIVCCIIGDYQYKYDTAKHKDDEHKDDEDVGGGRFSAWDQKLRLPSPPNGCYKRRGIYGGYRPTLLSPADLAAQQDDDVDKQFQQAWLHALRCPKSSDQCPDNGSDKHVAKRRRKIQQH
uniref:Uncharacterized protein n=1 Tax=Avena sativa TaxID=4498 RepID=A0ACD5TL90_AVESA